MIIFFTASTYSDEERRGDGAADLYLPRLQNERTQRCFINDWPLYQFCNRYMVTNESSTRALDYKRSRYVMPTFAVISFK